MIGVCYIDAVNESNRTGHIFGPDFMFEQDNIVINHTQKFKDYLKKKY